VPPTLAADPLLSGALLADPANAAASSNSVPTMNATERIARLGEIALPSIEVLSAACSGRRKE
jgi:hypothetical protein